MEGASSKGALNHLTFLEAQARSRKTGASQQKSGASQLKAKVEELKKQRDLLKAQIAVHQSLQKLRTSLDKNEDADVDETSENSKLLMLMVKHSQLKDVLLAHHLLGGYDVVKTNEDNSLCFSLPTAYQGTMLDTYHVEIDVKRTVRISRHNIPPFIDVESLAKETNMQENIRGFLDTLSLHLNAFSSRKHQLKLVKDLHKSVEVLESNALCSLLVLLLTIPKEKTALLCSLDYSDHTRSLPTRVSIKGEEKDLSDSPEWQKNIALLQETPVHEALTAMRETRHII
uniref:Centromere protein O n=1 Tax=Neogobius melanostomus TaxID=47308 RepID=A0A8C6SLU7_9GOBI